MEFCLSSNGLKSASSVDSTFDWCSCRPIHCIHTAFSKIVVPNTVIPKDRRDTGQPVGDLAEALAGMDAD